MKVLPTSTQQITLLMQTGRRDIGDTLVHLQSLARCVAWTDRILRGIRRDREEQHPQAGKGHPQPKPLRVPEAWEGTSTASWPAGRM